MQKKLKKTREEKFAEDFFPVEPEDIKYSIEKKYHPVDFNSLIKIEKVGDRETKIEFKNKKESSKKIRKKGVKKTKSGKIKNKAENFRAEKISLNKEGYELIITEKPQAALKIASALGKSTKRNIGNVPYYEVNRKGEKIFVGCAVGHLFTLTQRVPSSKTPVFDLVWVPNYFVRKKDFSKKYYDVLLKLISKAGKLTIATDYDTEGEVIGLNIVRFAAGQSDANRMKFSTLTEKEINQAYETKTSSLDWGQAIAGETRHYLDWFYGINLSRALMNAIKTTGKFKIMSIGRVQGPTLKLIVDKEREIQAFKSEPYWQVFITVKDPEVELKYIKDIFGPKGVPNWDKKELEKFKDLIGKKAQAQTKKTQQILPPNPPFNLTTLQTEAYRIYGISPSNTLKIAQSLYLASLISYPRTSSQKLPDSIDYKSILETLKSKYKVSKLIKRDKPIEGEKTDPAHPSIYPTGNTQILSGDEENIYDLIVKRFLCLFCEDAIIDKKRITAEVNNLVFSANGSAIKKKAWLDIYPSNLKELDLPDVNGEVTIINQRTEEKQTQPPRRYSPASILSELEKRNLGTKCLTGNTKIIFNGKKEKIRDIFNRGEKETKEKELKIRRISGKTISFDKESALITEPSLISKRKIKKEEKIIKIKTDCSTIKLTEDHLIYISRNNKIIEIPAKEIKIKDKLIGITKNYKEGQEIINENIFSEKYKLNEKEIKHKFSSKKDKGILKSKLPIKWSTSLAWVLGYYYGDGSYDGPKYNGSHSISFSTTEKKAVELLKETTKDIFGNPCYAYNLGSKYKVNLNSVMSYVLIKAFPKLEGKEPLNIPKEFIGDFLRGFFDADGNVHLRPKKKISIKKMPCNSFDTPRVKITLANEKLIKWIQKLLKNLDIETKINKSISTCNQKKFDCWTILISGRDKIEKFAYEVGFDNYKEKILYSGLKCGSPHYKILQNSAKISLALVERFKDTKTLIQETKLNHSQIKYALQRLQKLGIVLKKKKNQYAWNFYLNKKDSKYINHCMKINYNKIKKGIYEIPIKELSIENYSGYVYDLSIEKNSPNFITEGNILVHNSTRASILETLYDRGYVREKALEATTLGMSLIKTLEKYSPIIIDENLTKELQDEMDEIVDAKKEDLEGKEEKILNKAKKAITDIAHQFEKQENKIGAELMDAQEEQRAIEKKENTLIQCPKCKKGNLAITYSRKTRRQFIACDAYPECKNTFSLPPNGIIKRVDKICESCNFPMLMSLRKGKKPWIFCFNPECETNKEWAEKRKEYNQNKEE